MKLEFGKYTEITDFAKKVNPDMFINYKKVYICPDTLNWWLATIQEGINEDYDEDPDVFLVERDKIDYPNYSKCSDRFLNVNVVKNLIEDWDGSTWDNQEANDMDEAIELIDGGYGIIPED